VKKVKSVARQWNLTKDVVSVKNKYVAPYFCFIQSSGMGKTKLMYEFAKLTRMEGGDELSTKFSCDLILSSARIVLGKGSTVFDGTLDLQSFVRKPQRKEEAISVANSICDHLNYVLVDNRCGHFESVKMKETHVFLFDEAQKLLETHYGIKAFLFRCIRTWLRWKRRDRTMIAVFSGTSSSILNYTIPSDLEIDDGLVPDSSSRGADLEYFYSRGPKTFEPFFTLTTMAVLKPTDEGTDDLTNMAVLKATDEKKDKSEYGKSIRYGRPLFAKMHEDNTLERSIETVLQRLLLHTGKEQFEWSDETESWLSVLATRVQMGSTTLNVASRLVAKGYANLTGVTRNFATFAYLPDPVCARLAMCMMDENWSLGSLSGKSKKWWSEAVMTLYSTGLCRPDKGDVGEILAALHFLFCCDECRQAIDGNSEYTTFSVPLENWINGLLDESSSSGSCGKRKHDEPVIQLNFIQVCRDYTRSPWSGLADQAFLKNLYNAGTAFYTCPGCEMIDFVAPTVIIKSGEKPTYSSVVVSIKSRVYFAPTKAGNLCVEMKRMADFWKLKSTLCIVCVLGQEKDSNDGKYTYDASKMLAALQNGKNVATVLRLPRKDRFGLTDVFVEMTTIAEQSGILSSHSFLRARSLLLEAADAPTNCAFKNFKKYFKQLMKNMHADKKCQSVSCESDDSSAEPTAKRPRIS
jgi:hypothetical protein